MKQLDDPIDVATLDLDPENPRLPEDIQGKSQDVILTYLYENDVLEELIDSYLANGYFQSEPIIVLPEANGRRIVAEGNRRLAAMMILHQLRPAVDASIPLNVDEEPSAATLSTLSKVPAVEAVDQEDVAAFLGFRHISGLKRWGPEAKARWLYKQVTARAELQSDRGVFYDVGRQVGSNARGVRSAFVAYGLLSHAREILSIDASLVNYVADERFGVWTRLLGTANVTSYIGMGAKVANTYEEVRRQIDGVEERNLRLVLQDLTPHKTERAILGDSRDVTDYSDVLVNERAVSAMREYRSLNLAVEIIRQGDLAQRLREMTRSVEVLTLDIRRFDIGNEELGAVEEFALAARTLRGAVTAALAEDDA